MRVEVIFKLIETSSADVLGLPDRLHVHTPLTEEAPEEHASNNTANLDVTRQVRNVVVVTGLWLTKDSD